MAGLWNEIMDFLRLKDEEDYDEDEMYDNYDEKELKREEKRLQREQKKDEKRAAYTKKDYNNYDETVPFSSRKATGYSATPNKVVPMHQTSSSGFGVNIVKPANFGESQQVCDILLGGQPVVVNLEGIDIVEAQRIMDFISGCIYSITGNMRQVSRYIFIFAPKSIDISGDYIKNVATSSEGINIPTLNKEF